jgi:hypothetical protein
MQDRMQRRLMWARQLGAIVQGIVLGFLLVLALMELASLAGNLSPFRYQGF